MIKEFLKKPIVRYLLAGLAIVGLLVAMVLFLKSKKIEKAVSVPAPLPAVAYYPVPKALGPDSAPIQLVEYSDFECPSCKHAEAVIKTLFHNYPGKIRLVYHHFPLQSHKWSVYAHQAAECMHIQGKFWPYHDMLYAKQQEWSSGTTPPVEKLLQYARECGANMDSFTSCMADSAVTRGIFAEKEEGSKMQISATPTFIFEGQRFVGPQEMQGRGQNALRKVLGMAPLPLPPTVTPAAKGMTPAAKTVTAGGGKAGEASVPAPVTQQQAATGTSTGTKK